MMCGRKARWWPGCVSQTVRPRIMLGKLNHLNPGTARAVDGCMWKWNPRDFSEAPCQQNNLLHSKKLIISKLL